MRALGARQLIESALLNTSGSCMIYFLAGKQRRTRRRKSSDAIKTTINRLDADCMYMRCIHPDGHRLAGEFSHQQNLFNALRCLRDARPLVRRRDLAQAEEGIDMTTRFCTSCQATRDVEGGTFRKTGKSGRWICASCLAHKTESIYMNRSGKVADVKRIMNTLYARAR